MAVSAAQVAVGSSATALNTATPDGTTLVIKNGAAIINLGPSGVTVGTGLSVAASGQVTVVLKPGDVLYGICGTSSTVEVLRT